MQPLNVSPRRFRRLGTIQAAATHPDHHLGLESWFPMFERFKSWFAAKPPAVVVHPDFGTLTCDLGIWIGERQQAGRTIRFCVGGTETEPDAGLLRHLHQALERFEELERSALDFLCRLDPNLQPGEFQFYSLDFLWESKPDDFAFEFTLDGDPDGIWRVEFERGVPRSTGRDD